MMTLLNKEIKMKKRTITYVFGIIGALFWGGTVLLREMQVSDISALTFILGIMPNISASWVSLYIGELLVDKANKKFTFKVASIISVVVFLLALTSEIIHDLFLNSAFDVYDIIATILAILVYLIVLYISIHKSDR